MKTLLLLLAALLPVACGQFERAQVIEPQYAEYVERFESVTGWPVVNVSVVSAELSATVLGECRHAEKVVVINSLHWPTLRPLEREYLVFHELGHCVIGLSHTAGTLSDGCPQSIMDPVKPPLTCYMVYHDSYVNELLYSNFN